MPPSPLNGKKQETSTMFRSLGANIWDHEMPIRFGGIPLWHRMTVIRLTNGGLVVHSPTRLDLASQEEFQKLGPIVAIIAPSWWHDLYLWEYLSAYPNAKLYGAPTLCKVESNPAFHRSSWRLGTFIVDGRDRSSSCSRDRPLSRRDRILSSA